MYTKKKNSTPRQTRTVSFTVYTGSVEPFKVFVHIYENPGYSGTCKEPIKADCRPLTTNVFRSVVPNIPHQDVWYAYEIQLYSESATLSREDFDVALGTLDPVPGTITLTETHRRLLPAGVDASRDLLNFSKPSCACLSPEEKEEGLTFHIESILNGLHSGASLKTKLIDTELLLTTNTNLDTLRSSAQFERWLQDKFQQCSTDELQKGKLVLLSCVYGYIGPGMNLTNYVVENVFQSLSKADKEYLTDWALAGIKGTCHYLLREDGKYHWLYFAIHFHNIFDLDEILNLSQSEGLRGSYFPRKTVEDVLMPKIEILYTSDSYRRILEEIVKEFGLSEADKSNLSMLNTSQESLDMPGIATSMTSRSISALDVNPFCIPAATTENDTKVFVFHPPYPVSVMSVEPNETLQTPAAPEKTKVFVFHPPSPVSVMSGEPNETLSTPAAPEKTKVFVFHPPYPVSVMSVKPNETLSTPAAPEKQVVPFRVLVRLRDSHLSCVTVEIRNCRQTMLKCKPMSQIEVDHSHSSRKITSRKSRWWFAEIDVALTKGESYTYKYSIADAKGDNIGKSKERCLDFSKNIYDVFIRDDEKKEERDHTTAKGLLIYVDMIASCITPANLLLALKEVDAIGYPMKSSQPHKFIGWFQRCLPVLNPYQVIYMAVLLGKLLSLGHRVLVIPNVDNHKIALIIRLCYNHEQIPENMIAELQLACVWLVKGMNNGNWLHLWWYYSNLSNFMTSATLCEYHAEEMIPVFGRLSRFSESVLTMLLDREVENGQESLLQCVPLVVTIIDTVPSMASFKCVVEIIYKESYRSLAEEDRFTRAAVKKLRMLLEEKPQIKIKRLVETLAYFDDVNMTKLKEEFRLHMLQRMCREKWTKLDDIETILLTRDLYKTSRDLKDVTCRMFKEDSITILDILTKVLTRNDILELITDYDLREIVNNGIIFATSFFKKEKRKAYHAMYTMLAVVESLNKEPLVNFVDGKVYDSMKDEAIDGMLKSITVGAGKTLTDLESRKMNRITEHIKKRLHENSSKGSQHTKHLKTIREAAQEDCLKVDSSHVFEILMCMIDIQKPALNATELPESGILSREFESVIIGIVKDVEFWSMVFKVSGNFKKKILQSAVIVNFRCLFTHLVEQVGKECVTIGFLSDLETHSQNTSELLLHVLKREQTATLDEQMMRLKDSRERFMRCLKQLDQFSGVFIGHLTFVVTLTDRSTLEDEIRTRRRPDTIRNTIVNDTTTAAYWGPLNNVISEIQPICSLFHSKIFLNICRSLFEGDCPKYSEDKVDGIEVISNRDDSLKDRLLIRLPSEGITFTKLAHLLSNSCLTIFRQHCVILLESNLEVPLYVLDNLTDGITNEDLSQELQKVAAFFSSGKTQACIPDIIRESLAEYVKLPDLREKSSSLAAMCVAFGVSNEDTLYKASEETIHSVSRPDKIQTLASISDALRAIGIADKELGDDDWSVVNELGKCKDLICFLRPLINEDLEYLINAIDPRSEQYINVSIISDLLAVHRYLRPYLLLKSIDGRALLDAIIGSRDTAGKEKIDVKLSSCSHNFHSIEHFHKNIANRSETTKETILEALTRGVYTFYVDDRTAEGENQEPNTTKQQNKTTEQEFGFDEETMQCRVTLSYPRTNKQEHKPKESATTEAKYELDDLNDLRSRASLLVNKQTPGAQFLTEPTSEQLQEFIDAVTVVNRIICIRNLLFDNPWFIDDNSDTGVHSLQELEEIQNKMQISYDTWVKTLAEARNRHFYLTFFQSKQLKLLDDFFNGHCEVTEDHKLLFRFVHSDMLVTKQLCRDSPIPHNAPLELRLNQLGIALENSFRGQKPIKKKDIPSATKPCGVKLETPVRPGSVYVVELDKESTRSIPVLLRLYLGTCDAMPEPNEVVFCHEETTWEELNLLIQRCTHAGRFDFKHLYTIVNVELLQTYIQFQLIAAIKILHDNGHKTFMLALICRGGRYHHVIDQFSPNNTYQVCGLSDIDMKVYFQQGWPNVELVTSDQPGLGKSEYVSDMASEQECSIIWLHASGSVTKSELIQQLKRNLKSRKNILHIDVAAMPNPSVFDSFLFEVIAIGMSCSRTEMCTLPTSRVYIEVANTQQDKLINSLTASCAFRRKHITRPARLFSSFIVSKEIRSSVQVVCHYLKALKDGTINDRIPIERGETDTPLSVEECRTLMDDYISLGEGMSFTTVSNFLEISAMSLRSMSTSIYYTASNLKEMVGEGSRTVRGDLAKTILEASAEFSTRSVTHKSANTVSLVSHHSTSMVTANEMVARMKGMLKWSDTNHLLPVFNCQDSQTVSLVYRLLEHVPAQIKRLFKGQLRKPLANYRTKTQGELQLILERICRFTNRPFDKKKWLKELTRSYALTPDNFLKMVLIFLRIRCNIPVIIMGETGCGKTTLITYLAGVCEVRLEVLSIHAGVSKGQIESFVEGLVLEAEENLQEDIWGFLDEINTCDHLGMLNEIICHRRFHGKFLPSNLKFCAACNPYRLQVDASTVIKETEERFQNLTTYVSAETIGLKRPSFKHKDNEQLVYRVQQLPESMMDFVWDYGSLSYSDELRYIKRMIGFPDNIGCRFVHLLALSQHFVRKSKEVKCARKVYDYFKDNDSWFVQFSAIKNIPITSEGFGHSVSLRDVNRCKELQKWFTDMLKAKNVVEIRGGAHLNDLEIRSMVLALGHCYHSRLTTEEERVEYRRKIAIVISSHNRWNSEVTGNDIKRMIYSEQMDFLDRMTPPGFRMTVSRQTTSVIAKNEALRENVFIILVSMLNKIPVFVVGKPGCSKSLSMQLIKSSLRGSMSIDEYFKLLPRVCEFSFQGSESSTSEGIIEMFDMARDYKNKNPAALPYVFLDEIGLAEDSASNPLKVLHSQLEPIVGGDPSIAVVGISNYELDASKRNRAIQLSRPEPSVEDLALTAKTIRNKSAGTDRPTTLLTDEKLDRLANVYKQYQIEQKHPDFHGLRDYYFLVKYISLQTDTLDGDLGIAIERGLLRNFGGLTLDMNATMNMFSEQIGFEQQPDERPSVLELIEENVSDMHSRHLLLISHGDSALNILGQSMLTPSARSYDDEEEDSRHLEIILGSRFENDISEEYSYRILSQIILCMERNVLLVLKDLENIYGSLYDMLNQNYTIIGKGKTAKRTCRVALGSYSNPVCYVHDGFRCIVLVDEDKLNKQDPPFLNRFEKQTLRYTDLMNDHQLECINRLNRWMDSFSCSKGSQFNSRSMFLGYHSESLTSLVFQHSSVMTGDTPRVEDLFNCCKTDLMKVACPDAVLRLRKSILAEESLDEVKIIEQQYFQLPIHDGLRAFMRAHLTPREMKGEYSQPRDPNTIIYTHSSIYTDISRCMGDSFTVQVVKMNRIKSERMLSNQVEEFWMNSDAEILFIQCLPDLDGPNMMLVKCTIDQIQSQDLKMPTGVRKHVCILVHLDRATDYVEDTQTRKTHGHFNFQKGWQQFAVDSLEDKSPSLHNLIYGSSLETSGNFCLLSDLLDTGIVSTERIVHDQTMWCLSCIKYSEHERSGDSFAELLGLINGSPNLKRCIQLQIRKYIMTHDQMNTKDGDNWQVEAACDTGLMFRCSTLIEAMLDYIKCKVRIPLAKMIFFLEKSCAWPGDVNEEVYDVFWRSCFHSKNVFDILSKELPEPRGAETYEIGNRLLRLQFPFFTIFYSKIEMFCEWLLQDMPVYDSENQVDVISLDKYAEQVTEHVASLSEIQYNHYLDDHVNDYSFDFCVFVSVNHLPNSSDSERYKIMNTLLTQFDIKLAGTDLTAAEYVSRLHLAMCYFQVQLISILKLLALEPVSEERSIGSLLTRCLSPDHEGDHTSEDGTQEIVHPESLADDMDIDVEVASTTVRQIDDEPTNAQQGYLFRKKDKEDLPIFQDSAAAGQNHGELVEATEELTDTRHEDESDAVSLEEIEICDVSRSFQVNLVKEMCRLLLPHRSVVEKFGGIGNWLGKATAVILLSGNVNRESSSLHSLRLCRDFTTVAINYNVSLDEVSELAGYTECDSINSDCVIQFINDRVSSYISAERVPERVTMLHEFQCRYFTICLQENLDTPLLPQIIEPLTNESGMLLVGAHSVLHTIIRSELQGDVCETLIQTGNIDVTRFPNFEILDGILRNSKMGSSLAVACSDIVEDTAFNDITRRTLDVIETEDNKHLKLVAESSRIVNMVNKDSTCSFQFVCAVAYLRKFLQAFEYLLRGSEPMQFKREAKYSIIGSVVSGIFQSDKDCLRLVFLRGLKQFNDLIDLRKLCDELATTITPLRELPWQENLQSSRLGYNPMGAVKHYAEAKTVIVEWQIGSSSDNSAIDQLLTKAGECPEYRLAILAAVAESFYWTQTTTTGRSDSDTLKANELMERTKNFNPYFKVLLERFLGVSDFGGILKISEQTNLDDLQRISVLVRIACTIAAYSDPSHRQRSLFTAILSGTAQDIHLLPGIGSTTSALSRFKMQCGSKIGSNATVSTECIRCMSPAAYRVLDLIVHGCLLVGMACSFKSETDVRSTATRIGLSGANDDIESLLYKRLKRDWLLLQEILCCNAENVTLFLHMTIEDVADIQVGDYQLQTELERDKLEQTLTEKIQHLVRAVPDCQRMYKAQCFQAQDISTDSLEGRLGELDNGECDINSRMFRARSTPTFEDLRARFISDNHGRDCNYPFLQLCIGYHECLQLLHNLPVFLEWNNLITSRLSQNIKRHKGTTTTIGYFLDNEDFHLDISSQASARNLFKRFKDAWTESIDGARRLLDSKVEFQMITYETSLVDCILDKSSPPCPLQRMISSLQNLQNDFLTKAMEIAKSGRCSSLSFMVDDSMKSRVKEVNLAKAKSEIIQYHDTQNLLHFSNTDVDKMHQFSNVDTRYGYGSCITYNLTVIERELARVLVMNKAILHSGTMFTKFTYTDELFHACSEILIDIRQIVPQQHLLGKDILNALEKEHDESGTFATQLLEQLEVVLVLLKKTGGKPDDSLYRYIRRWSTKLPGSFPERLFKASHEHIIQLQHIVELYKHLEKLLMNNVIATLDAPFRDEIPAGTQKALIQELKHHNLTDLEMILDIIRRFVFRYVRPITSTNAGILETTLVDVIKRCTGDASDIGVLKTLVRIASRDINLCHVADLTHIISKTVKQLQDYDSKKQKQAVLLARSAPTTRTVTQGAPRGARGSRRVAKGGMCMS